MRGLFVWILLFLLVGTAAGILLEEHPGFIRIQAGPYLIETSLWMGVLILMATVLAFLISFGTVGKVITTSRNLVSWAGQRGNQRARQKTTAGLLEFAEGNWEQAQKLLTRGANKHETPLINYLAAAQAAFKLGDEKESDRLLKKAYETTEGAALAVGITQAQLQMDRGQWEQCLATLLRLKKDAPQHPFVLKLLSKVLARLGEWNQLYVLIPELDRRHVLEKSELERLSREAAMGLLRNAALDCQRKQGSSHNIDQLTAAWDRLRNETKKSPEVVTCYCQQLATLEATEEARQTIEAQLKRHWNPALLDIYGCLNSEASSAQENLAKTWLKKHPEDPALFRALGRISLRQHKWDQALEYFETSLRFKKDKATYAELGRLLAAMGRHHESSKYLTAGLLPELSLPSLPNPETAKI